MYSFELTVEIDAPAARVWRALCDPAEVVQWDTGVEAALDAPPDYPRPGQHVRWRYRHGIWKLLHDRPQDVVEARRLRSLLALGPVRFDETYTLDPREAACALTASMHVTVPAPVVGHVVALVWAGPQARDTVRQSLAAIKRHCETG